MKTLHNTFFGRFLAALALYAALMGLYAHSPSAPPAFTSAASVRAN